MVKNIHFSHQALSGVAHFCNLCKKITSIMEGIHNDYYICTENSCMGNTVIHPARFERTLGILSFHYLQNTTLSRLTTSTNVIIGDQNIGYDGADCKLG